MSKINYFLYKNNCDKKQNICFSNVVINYFIQINNLTMAISRPCGLSKTVTFLTCRISAIHY